MFCFVPPRSILQNNNNQTLTKSKQNKKQKKNLTSSHIFCFYLHHLCFVSVLNTIFLHHYPRKCLQNYAQDFAGGMDGGWERGSGGGTYIYMCLIHVDGLQKPTQYCNTIILQLKGKLN